MCMVAGGGEGEDCVLLLLRLALQSGEPCLEFVQLSLSFVQRLSGDWAYPILFVVTEKL